MKKYLLLALTAMALIFVSCKSTEQEKPEDDQTQQVVEQPAGDENNGDKTDASQAKTNAEKNALLLEKVDESRSNAIKAGAQEYFTEKVDEADKKLKELRELASNSDKDYSAQLNDLNYRYLALQKASETKALKAKIEENGFNSDHQAAYDAAEKLLAELEKLIAESDDGKLMYKSAEATYAAYHAIYFDSFKKLANKERDAALAEKKNADSVKAGVARKEEYKNTTELLTKGDSCYATKNPEGAYDNYKLAKEKFAALYKDVSEKRAAAQKKIDEAKEKVRNVDAFAEQADEVAPIGDQKIDGIEEKDTVLLEEDKFQDPEEAVIKVDETVEVK
ncbi:hypothetical protein [Treponema sp.]|uniref:hypothetical protein n=1 Tax=Treponema sp. TaxID=166 RepID=UPI00298E08C4|nr:hypothetical protein [Treponema sp.]MCR5614119.1 hypothetical protein [Treponema sp.]